MREWTQEHGDSEDLSWRLSQLLPDFERWLCLLSLWLPAQVTRKDEITCADSQKPSFTEQRIDFSKYPQKRHPKVDSPYQEENLGIWFTLRRGPLCDIMFTALGGQERESWYCLPLVCWSQNAECFPEPALESQRTFQKVQWWVSGADFSHCGWAWSGHTAVETSQLPISLCVGLMVTHTERYVYPKLAGAVYSRANFVNTGEGLYLYAWPLFSATLYLCSHWHD